MMNDLVIIENMPFRDIVIRQTGDVTAFVVNEAYAIYLYCKVICFREE